MTGLLLAHGDGAVCGAFSGWTFILRFGQFLVNAAPTLLVGVLLAGWLCTRAGHAWLIASLDGPPRRSMLRAAVLGLVWPVGALGALPAATVMLRAGLRPSVAMGFLVTAPLFLPWSAGLLADQVGLLQTACVLGAGVLLALLVGASVRSARPCASVPSQHAGSAVMTALRAAAHSVSGPLLIYTLVAAGGSAALAAVLEPGSIEAHLEESAVTTLLILAVPLALASIEPDVAVTFAGEFWRIGLLPGGVLVSLLLGAAWNLGVATWSIHRLRGFGLAANVVWISAALLAAVVFNSVLRPERLGEADSHAFDMLTKPYDVGDATAPARATARLRSEVGGHAAALAALGALVLLGVVERIRAPRRSVKAPAAASARGNPAMPTQSRVRTAIGGAVLLCVGAGVYTYFPPLAELEERLRLQSGNLYGAASTLCRTHSSEAQRSGARQQALNALDKIEETLARYPVARVLHRHTPPGEADTAELRRAILPRMRMLIEQGDYALLRAQALAIAGRPPRGSRNRRAEHGRPPDRHHESETGRSAVAAGGTRRPRALRRGLRRTASGLRGCEDRRARAFA